MTTSADIRSARAYAIAVGEDVGARGRLDPVHVTVWEQAGRPVLYGPELPPKTTGGRRGGRASTITVGDSVRTVTKADSRNARSWAVEQGIEVPVKGRLAASTLQGWADAGAVEYGQARVERASVIYRKTLDKAGRRNARLAGKLHTVTVWSDQLPSTKPKSSDYVDAVSGELPHGAVVERIITANTIIDVTVDDETGGYVYRWVSKADSREVVNTLKGNLLVRT